MAKEKENVSLEETLKEIQKMFHLENAIFCVSAHVGK